MKKNKTDGQSYTGPDSGCEMASEILGHPSCCLYCPIPNSCQYDNPVRETKILQMFKDGMSPGDIAIELKLDWRLVQRVING